MKFAYITGQDTSRRRKRILGLFRQGKIDVLVANKIIDEGFDAPIAETLILAAGGKSEHVQTQRIGRITRAHEGKDRATVFDFSDAGYYLSKHSEERQLAYEMEPSFHVETITDSEFREMFDA